MSLKPRLVTGALVLAAATAATVLPGWPGHPAQSPGAAGAAVAPQAPRAQTPPQEQAGAVQAAGAVEAQLRDRRPNIVLITTDDMAKTDLRWMPRTRRLLENRGVEIGDFISNHPLCCPARAQILTGQQAHNNGVHDNGGRWGSYDALRRPANHVGAWLKEAGYKTAFVGKHLNGWPRRAHFQPGWTVFDPTLRGVYAPFGITMFNNGRPRHFDNVYTGDLIGRRTVGYINRFAGRRPFFIWSSQVAPHGMFVDGAWVKAVPAPRHANLYPNAMPPSLSDPSFNEYDVGDKPRWVKATGMVSREQMTSVHRARIRSLAAVDEHVAGVVRALRAKGELRNTYIFFTSDNGYLLGEHRLTNKNKIYEQSLQVPLLVRGPGLKQGITRRATYGMADLAPTFVQLAQATARRRLDGRSMLGTLRRGGRGYQYYLVQAALGVDSASTGPFDGRDLEWWWRGVRSRSFAYARYEDGFEELYDMAKDPHQLRNVARAAAYQKVRRDLARRLRVLQTCSGRTCRTGGS